VTAAAMKLGRGDKLSIFVWRTGVMNASRRTWFGILTLSLALAVLTSGIRAEDKKSDASATGTWKSTFTGKQGQTFKTIFKLKQDGDKLNGTVIGRDGKEAKIDEGKVKEGKLSFQVTREFNAQKFTIRYKGDLSGDTIKGKMEFGQGDRSQSIDWEAKREKKQTEKQEK
jgi:hypothetical protein